jgi:hypothetical protein
MAIFKLNDFLSNVRKKDLARSSRFEIVVTAPTIAKEQEREVSLLCEEAAIPGLIATFSPTKIGNWTEYRAHGIEFFGDNATFTFIVNSDWNVREFFEQWMGNCVDITSKEVAFYDDIIGNVEIYSLDRGDNRTGSWELIEAWPRLLNLTPMSQASDAPVRVTVTFTYRLWESKALKETTGPLQNVRRFMNILKDNPVDFLLNRV